MEQLTTRLDLLANGIRVFVDGEEMNISDPTIPNKARAGFYDDKDIRIYHKAYKYKGRSAFLNPSLYTQYHPKGIIKEFKYYMVGFGLWQSPAHSTAMPLHKLLYIWFYNDLETEAYVGHINSNTLDNRLSNLKQMTRKEIIAMRKGAVNQYGTRRKEREISQNVDIRSINKKMAKGRPRP